MRAAYLRHWILDEKNQPIEVDLMTWAQWFEEPANRIVKQTLCSAGTCEVSTVFMGINHNFSAGPPLLLETMVFGGAADTFQDRYSTYEQAELYHDVVVGQVEAIPVWKHALANVARDLRSWFDSLKREIRNWRD